MKRPQDLENSRKSGEQDRGVILRAENGDVIAYDQTGLVLRLSDRVIWDIAQRLSDPRSPSASGEPAKVDAYGDVTLDGIDAWDMRTKGEWVHFTAHLPGRQGVRGFRRLLSGGAIVADSNGPLYGILGIGGARAALANPQAADFPQHVVAPADDIGAVGVAGVEEAAQLDTLEHLREMTHEALVADTILATNLDDCRALPLFMVRGETDHSARVSELSQGMAFQNLIRAAENLKHAAERLGKTPRLTCITLDFAAEDVVSSAKEYRDGMLSLMNKIETALEKLGFHTPLFVARLEAGRPGCTSAVVDAQWELAWDHGPHRLLFSAPSYMFELDRYDRPTDAARRDMAEMTAAALADPDHWKCPIFHLAERTKNPAILRVTARARDGLEVDADDPLAAGVTAGFGLLGTKAQITKVAVDPKDPQALLLTCQGDLSGPEVKLTYAVGEISGAVAAPLTGAVRDGWSRSSATGRILHRWALPCILPVTGGGDA